MTSARRDARIRRTPPAREPAVPSKPCAALSINPPSSSTTTSAYGVQQGIHRGCNPRRESALWIAGWQIPADFHPTDLRLGGQLSQEPGQAREGDPSRDRMAHREALTWIDDIEIDVNPKRRALEILPQRLQREFPRGVDAD